MMENFQCSESGPSYTIRIALKPFKGTVGFDLNDGFCRLLDSRLADDTLLFARSASEAVHMLDDLLNCLDYVGLLLNADKTVILTTEAQPPAHVNLADGHQIRILPRTISHKWLGCMLSAQGSKQHGEDVVHHLSAASRAFFASSHISRDRTAAMQLLLSLHALVRVPEQSIRKI